MEEPAGLAPEQLSTLDRLRRLGGLEQFYLAGGTGVAFHLGHRRSLDLDLFSVTADVDLESARAALLQSFRDAVVVSVTDVTLRMRLAGCPVDLVRYPYPTLEPPAPGPSDFPVAGLRDLATMKLAAIARRGVRRDFWDAYAIFRRGISLRQAAKAYVERFGVAEADLYHVLRSLTYFADAEKDPTLPMGLTAEEWKRIKTWFRAHAPELLRDE